ncbi:MAG: pseudouridine synthase [Maritimibacter sp.]
MTDKPSSPAGDRIAKVLSRAGVASRREAERMIEAGRVRVNGEVITSPALNVTPRDAIMVDEFEVGAPEPARLWLYHKPLGLVTTERDEKGRETVFDALPKDMPRVMSVGRLDLNSEGLLLLTNDGEIKRKLELPSTGWTRKYRVRVRGNPSEDDLTPLRRGIVVDGERFQPMVISLDRHQGANAWLTVSLQEGKNREIRRAMEAVGLVVNRLLRVSYGPFRLEDLKPGEVEELRAKVVRDQLGLAPLPEDADDPSKPIGKPGAKPQRGKPQRSRKSAPPRGKPDPVATFKAEGNRFGKSGESSSRKPSDRPFGKRFGNPAHSGADLDEDDGFARKKSRGGQRKGPHKPGSGKSGPRRSPPRGKTRK